MIRGLFIFALAVAVVGGTAACGKKGPLEAPPASAIAAPGEVRPA